MQSKKISYILAVVAIMGGLSACAKREPNETDMVIEPDAKLEIGAQPNQSEATPDEPGNKRRNSTECPRLIQKKVDSTQVLRHDTISTKSCDYFIYPKPGDVVTASVSDGRLAPSLIRPATHDFANGSYIVQQTGRHVIRLEYDAIGRKPDVMDYVIEVDIASPYAASSSQ